MSADKIRIFNRCEAPATLTMSVVLANGLAVRVCVCALHAFMIGAELGDVATAWTRAPLEDEQCSGEEVS